MSMITASTWVPRGAAAAFPEKYDVNEDELARISKLAKLQLDDAQDDLDEATHGGDDPNESDIAVEEKSRTNNIRSNG